MIKHPAFLRAQNVRLLTQFNNTILVPRFRPGQIKIIFWNYFYSKKRTLFFAPHPPAFPPEPLKGGLCHAPRKSGTPPKKGRGSGGNFGEKTRQNPAKIGLKWGFLGGFGGQK